MRTFNADFLVIGTGAAGAVLGRVLSDNGQYSVICLEAGQNVNRDPMLVAPVPGIDYNAFGPRYFWPGNTLPDPDAGGRIFNWTNGRVLGGGTSIFGMLTTRGTVERFDEWTPLVGPNWTGQKVYEAYRQMERFFGQISDPENHGKFGPQSVRLGVSDSSTTPQYLEAFQSTGAPGTNILIDDYNNPNTPIGVFPNWQYFQFPDQTRASSSRSFLGPNVIDERGIGVNGRKLAVFTQTTATHLIWSKRRNKVKGVAAVMNGEPILIKVKRKVILSAGFKSSAFLQVNGIGPLDVLEPANIPVRIPNENVGRGLKNGYFIVTILLPPPGTTFNSEPGSFNEFGAFLPDPRPGSPLNIRNVQISTSLRNNIPPFVGTTIALIIVEAPLRPKSSGSIRVTNADPLKLEEADIGFLHDPDDLEQSAATFDEIVTPAIRYLQDNFGYTLIFPPLATLEDPAALRTFIRNNVGNGHHYQCCNKMGRDPSTGVVDEWGNVFGAANLSVVDDTIAPLNTDGNTGFTAEMLAWRIGRHYVEEANREECEKECKKENKCKEFSKEDYCEDI